MNYIQKSLSVGEASQVLSTTAQLVEQLEKMFEDPSYQSVFLAASKHNVYYHGVELQPYIQELKRLLFEPEQVDDPVVNGDANTVVLTRQEVEHLMYGVWPRDMTK